MEPRKNKPTQTIPFFLWDGGGLINIIIPFAMRGPETASSRMVLFSERVMGYIKLSEQLLIFNHYTVHSRS